MAHITFSIEYGTKWGETLRMDYAKRDGTRGQLQFDTTDGLIWTGSLDMAPYDGLTYTYIVQDSSGTAVRALREATFELVVGREASVVVMDRWAERDVAPWFLHTAFTDCVFADRSVAAVGALPDEGHCQLRMRALPPPAGKRWAVAGSVPALGAWCEEAVRPLRRTGVYEWSLELDANELTGGAEYKYVLVDELAARMSLTWETGENRRLAPMAGDETVAMVVNDDAPRIDVPTEAWRGAGVVIPVFSLRSRGSQGIGDFGDLAAFVRWAAGVGFAAVQILPINDTTSTWTWRDSYPYNGISVFALHPAYLDMREWTDQPAYAAYAERAKALNARDTLDYEAVMALKTDFLISLYTREGRHVTSSGDYADFLNDNAAWLLPYAAFCREKAHALKGGEAPEAEFFCFVQFLLHRQMLAAHDAARDGGVILKGDIPIGVCRDSVPATVDSRLFHFDGQAGAPPDAFATKGQNWGFPTYNWEAMAEDGYAWWQRRLAHMANYFDAYRIDHVLGFFRIWEVPTCQRDGLLGYFRPALPLTAEEVKGYGFTGDCERYATAHVSEQRFWQLQEAWAGTDLMQYLTRDGQGDFRLREDYATQHDIMAAVGEGALRELLLDIACEVLFIKDPDTGGYHPRIAGQQTKLFEELTDDDRAAFNRLHDDFFYFRHNAFWAERAMEKLPAVISAKRKGSRYAMLPCAEDLGMIPASVKGVLERLHILSLEIQRMPKAYGVRFGNPADNPYLSVATIATHDMPPFRLWWHEDRETAQAFWNEALGHQGEAPQDAEPEVCEQVVMMHLNSPSMLCLNALQDYLAMDAQLRNPHYEMEQINVPANAQQYWQYRMHLDIEDLVAATAFNEKLRNMVKSSGR